MFTGEPWVRWPPCGRLMPSTVSPGCSTAKKTAWFACAPECGCDVGVLGTEQLLDAVDRELFGDVDELAAAVVALARIALGVLVGQLRALRRHDRRAGVILRRDQLDVLFLAPVFALIAFHSSGSAWLRVCARCDIGSCRHESPYLTTAAVRRRPIAPHVLQPRCHCRAARVNLPRGRPPGHGVVRCRRPGRRCARPRPNTPTPLRISCHSSFRCRD